jgi:mannose-1-phosphate guanylyltransferase/mannose-6-phosphate isomerase
MLIPVILSGGSGTRLWPVSRSAYPKPFMRMADGQSLLYKTFDRAWRLADGGRVLTVTGRDYYFLSRDEYAHHPDADLDRLPFLLEPVGRNTAPAVCLAALYTMEHIGAEATLLVLPADHLIANVAAFGDDVRKAQTLAEDGRLVTFGIPPTTPETGFGYIRMGDALSAGRDIAAFVEKPDHETAERYVASGNYAWNSGMFCFRADALIAAAEKFCPDVLQTARACHASATGWESPVEYSREAFMAMPNISIDYALMERAERRAVVPARFDWSDIGSWKAISEMASGGEPDAAGNRVHGSAVVIESTNCFIQADQRIVAVVGVKDLVVVDTGDAVLVADRERAQEVKQVVDHLRETDHASARFHRTVHRPWGSFTILEDASDCKVKRLTVKPGEVLSLQMHHRRSEHWTVVSGTAKVRVGDEEFLLGRNESTFIPIGTLHRLENPTGEDLHLIEVQCGDYFGEDDIVRLEDRYGRAPPR